MIKAQNFDKKTENETSCHCNSRRGSSDGPRREKSTTATSLGAFGQVRFKVMELDLTLCFRLVEFSAELLDDWFDFLASKDAWKNKFEINAARMAANFQRGNQRCGFYDPSLEHGGPPPSTRRRRQVLDDNERYNRGDPVEGTRQITTGFRKWAERYLSRCSGQVKYQYQVNRMEKWNGLLQAKLANQ